MVGAASAHDGPGLDLVAELVGSFDFACLPWSLPDVALLPLPSSVILLPCRSGLLVAALSRTSSSVCSWFWLRPLPPPLAAPALLVLSAVCCPSPSSYAALAHSGLASSPPPAPPLLWSSSAPV